MRLVRVALESGPDRLFTYFVHGDLSGSISKGSRVRVPLGKRFARGYVIGFSDEAPPEGVKPVSSAVDGFPVFCGGLLELAFELSEYYLSPPGEMLKAMLPGKIRLMDEKPPVRRSGAHLQAPEWADKTVAGRGVFVLGDAGAGKEPEIYAALAAACLNAGKQALFLFPDASSLAANEKTFNRLLHGLYAVYHGSLGAKNRRSIWEGTRSGRVRAVLGLRTAVFLPFSRPGLIAVHDEADFSYKSRRTPRYNAARAAVLRGRIQACPVVLGGNFPSFETCRKIQSADYASAGLPPAEKSMPPVRIIDMRYERAKVFSRQLKQVVFEALDGGHQALLYANRRGFSSYFVCRACGFLKRCPNCSVCLRYHADREALLCHYCSHQEEAGETCTSCGRSYFRKAGFGTQQVESLVNKIFRGARVARLDSDAAGSAEAAGKVIREFREGNIDVLVDTGISMDSGPFENVSACGIMSADNLLHIPDFRAAENMFRFVLKAAGAAGREAVLAVQTYNPAHYAVDCLKTLDRSGFYARESVVRKKLGYPPFGGLCNIIVSGKDEAKTDACARGLAGFLRENLPPAAEVLGPVPAVVSKARNTHRRQVLLKYPVGKEFLLELRELLIKARERGVMRPGIKAAADVDPVNTA